MSGGGRDIMGRVYRLMWRAYDLLKASRGINLREVRRRRLYHLFTETATELGLEVEIVGPVLQVRRGGRIFRVFEYGTDFDTLPVCAICGDKVLCRRLFAERGLRVPEGEAFHRREMDRAVAFALALKRPCVVKPARDTAGGKGVTLGVSRAREIRKAVRKAGVYCTDVLVEEQIEGEHLRLLVYKGRCLSAILRQPAQVVGDGSHTVAELVALANEGRLRRSERQPGDFLLMPLTLDRNARRLLKRQGLRPQSVPAAGRVVQLQENRGYSFGTSYWDVTDRIHPHVAEAAERAAEIVGATLAGVDMISRTAESESYWIHEINTTPGIAAHYLISNPEACKDPIRVILRDYFDV